VIAAADIAACFEPYRPDGWNTDRALANLEAKLIDSRFVRDLETIINEWPEGYTIDDAAHVTRNIIAKWS
jgi:hypothetical protein